ncbi:hypothetical protein GQ53DRAFT_783845 [Thozetella sp. PMI_491]|nr:hypothetical protein GQ53DRAFT_783845 [Thozetella sp. PMI_491]
MATHEASIAEGSVLPKNDRRANGSPPPGNKPPSKKLKRDQMITDRLNSLSEEATRNPDPRFRELLQRIQVDSSLVQGLDVRSERPLDALEEEQLKMRIQNSAHNHPVNRTPQTLLEMCGPKFEDFALLVQDLLEEKDYSISKAKLDFEKKHSEYLATHGFEIETANREHKMLRDTTRDRIINNIISKKHKLLKEREGLEMNPESSALLFHPNQFTLTNPASPGGTHNKRSTRQRRDADDISGVDNKKRKRIGAGDDDGSPGPQRRALDGSNTTAIWQGDRLVNRSQTASVYSIDKLFTDKELSMTYNTAALQAHKYLQTHKPRYDENGQPVSSPEESDSGEERDDQSEHTAPQMERNMSHATRSTRGGQNLPENIMGLEALADFLPDNYKKMIAAIDPKLPPTFPSTYIKNHAKHDFNTPTSLSMDDAGADLLIMKGLTQHDYAHGKGSNFDSEHGSRTILEAVSKPAREHRFVAYLQGDRPPESDLRRRLDLPPRGHREDADPVGTGTPSKLGRSGTPAQISPAKGAGPTSAPALGGVPMSRQSSAGGTAMSRSSSRKGRVRG